MPGPPTRTGLDIEEVRGSLEDTRHLRMALDVLEERLLPAYSCDGLESELWGLREKIDAAELAQLAPSAPRIPGHPAARPGRPWAADHQAAQAVKTLDGLGLVIRLT